MKKILIKAFTLVELIVVISIMTLITTSSVFYFIDFIDNKEVVQKINIIEENLNQLDSDVKKYKSFDYKLIFNTTSLSGGYITYINDFDLEQNQTITLNTSTLNGTISISGTNTANTGTLKLYKRKKLFLTKEIQYSSTINFAFNTEPYYKIKSTLSGVILNDININYFSEDNLYPDKYNSLNLLQINTEEDKTGTDISTLIITNIGGKKVFYNGDSSSEITSESIFLFFKNNGVEKFIKITK